MDAREQQSRAEQEYSELCREACESGAFQLERIIEVGIAAGFPPEIKLPNSKQKAWSIRTLFADALYNNRMGFPATEPSAILLESTLLEVGRWRDALVAICIRRGISVPTEIFPAPTGQKGTEIPPQSRDELERMLELAGRTCDLDEIKKWADLQNFPINEALRLCESGTFKLHFVHGDCQGYTTISAEKAIELVLGFAFPCEISTGHISLETPLGHWEIREDNLSMARYYIVLLVARLWAIKHAPGDLPVAPTMQTLLDYLNEVPDQEDPDYYEIRSLARIAGLSDHVEAQLNDKTVVLNTLQIMEEIAPSVVKCDLQADGSMKIWYHDTPGEVYILAGSPWIQVFEALNQWLAKHPD